MPDDESRAPAADAPDGVGDRDADAEPGAESSAASADEVIAAIDTTTLPELPTSEVRRLRRLCEEAEEAVSYARRLLQGRLDILRAELLRRDADGEEEAGSLVTSLVALLSADHVGTDPMHARATRVRVPPGAERYTARLDSIADEAALSAAARADLADIRDIAERFADEERALSAQRRGLFDRIDALRDELAARYKDGRTDVTELLDGR